MKKTWMTIVSIIIITALLTACGAQELPEGFSEEKVINQAEYVVSLLSAKDYEGVAALFAPVMEEGLNAEGLETAIGAQIDKLGAFVSVSSSRVAGGNDKTVGDYGIVVLSCDYENGKATYTISIDSNYQVCGLYMK